MPTNFKEENVRTHEHLASGPLLLNKNFVLKNIGMYLIHTSMWHSKKIIAYEERGQEYLIYVALDIKSLST